MAFSVRVVSSHTSLLIFSTTVTRGIEFLRCTAIRKLFPSRWNPGQVRLGVGRAMTDSLSSQVGFVTDFHLVDQQLQPYLVAKLASTYLEHRVTSE